MKKTLRLTSMLLTLVYTSTAFGEETVQEQRYSLGVGMGALYSGIGANLSLISKSDMKYISAGCTEYTSITGSSCGFGAGWIKTDLFDFDSNKHGFGVYATLVGKESNVTYTASRNGVDYYKDENDIYGLGVSYTYFINGIDQSGATFGLSLHATNADFEDSFGGFFQVGYHF